MVLSRWCYVPHDSAHLFNSLPTTSRFLRRCQIPNYTAWRQRHNGKQLAQGCYILQCPDGESIASRDFSIASRLPYRCASSYTLYDQLITHYFNIHIMPKLVSVLLLILQCCSTVKLLVLVQNVLTYTLYYHVSDAVTYKLTNVWESVRSSRVNRWRRVAGSLMHYVKSVAAAAAALQQWQY